MNDMFICFSQGYRNVAAKCILPLIRLMCDDAFCYSAIVNLQLSLQRLFYLFPLPF